ncbi:MAG: tetratricopeptide repeat protein, partial [Candidatus Omnitrophica bacterium]|nr:tetratricopeptide repeat protein [Candidatus Omnitrophota bacterium]
MKKKIFFTLIFLGLLKSDNTFALSSLMYKQAEEYYRQGMREKEMGNFAEAKKYLQKAVAINPALREAHMQLANLYAREGRDAEAEKFYRKTGEIIPSEEIEFVEHKEGKILRELPFSECPECEKREIFKEAKEWETELIEAEGEKKEIFLKESGALEGRYTGIVQRDLYKAQRKGPTIVSKLDPYHPEHKDFKIPYYKDREGLKLTPIVGVRGEYNYEKQLVGIESLLQEAQEFNQRDTEQAKRYITLNRKTRHVEEIVLHY